MSLRAILWALNDAPVDDPTDALILTALAERAGEDGTAAWPAISEVAYRARCSVRTVHRRLPTLIEQGVLTLGDQRLVEHLRRDRRPVVYDLNLALVRGDSLTPRDADGVTPEAGRGDTGDADGVTPVSDKPSMNPTDEPSLFGETAPAVPQDETRPESRTRRVNRLARHICDASEAMKARGFHRWRESIDAVVVVKPDLDDEGVLAVMRELVASGLALTRDNAVRAAEGTLAQSVGRRVDNRHIDRDRAGDPEDERRRAMFA